MRNIKTLAKQSPVGTSFNRLRLAVAVSSAFGLVGGAQAFEIDTDSDWLVRWDNSVQYNLGSRARNADSKISNSLFYGQGDNKFSRAGDLVTNKLSVLSELDANYKNLYGARISGQIWKDFAYDDKVHTAPGFEGTESYDNARYSNYTKRYYLQGAQLLDAFVFLNLTPEGDHPTSIKLGRTTQTWGNALFLGGQGISYAQSPIDVGKALSTPGAQLKELFLPRTQISAQTKITDDLALGFQYFLDWRKNRLNEGGTYLATGDFLYNGPTRAFLAPGFALNHGADFEPDKNGGDFGVRLAWSPAPLDGTVSLYYRRLSDTTPWGPLFGVNAATGAIDYHLSYAKDVDLFGISLDKRIGDYSFGFEASYRHNTALNSAFSVFAPLPRDLAGSEGARGDITNVVANVVVGLTPTPLYQTGIAIVELGWGHLNKVTKNEELYSGVNTAVCGSKWNGCSTKDVVNLAFLFSPQWLQVFPGVDISMPISDTIGLYGNGATPQGTSGYQGSHNYSVGLEAKVDTKYTINLSYVGYYYRPRDKANNGPHGEEVYTSGNGGYMLNDKPWLSLTLKTTF